MTSVVHRREILLMGRVNSGKSSLFNRLLRQNRSVVSDQPGTTTDSLAKAVELPRIGAVLIVDTPGLADATRLGALRERAAGKALNSADLILYLLSDAEELRDPLFVTIRKRGIPILPVIPKCDLDSSTVLLQRQEEIRQALKAAPVCVSAADGTGIDALLMRMEEMLRETGQAPELLGGLCASGDLVLLVMPQDGSAPAGRLILPQVQTIRALLDKGCPALCTTPAELPGALSRLSAPPALIITDSQAFAQVEPLVPRESRFTSFSILMSAQRGDLARLVSGARAMDRLTEQSRVLIAEACAHTPQGEDIGTVKIPARLRRRYGAALRIDHVSGRDFPDDLSPYDLVIHCGACMFNRQLMLRRQELAAEQDVPMTNYGIAIAHLLGILNRVDLPCSR